MVLHSALYYTIPLDEMSIRKTLIWGFEKPEIFLGKIVHNDAPSLRPIRPLDLAALAAFYTAVVSKSSTAFCILAMMSTSKGQRSRQMPHSTHAEAFTGNLEYHSRS